MNTETKYKFKQFLYKNEDKILAIGKFLLGCGFLGFLLSLNVYNPLERLVFSTGISIITVGTFMMWVKNSTHIRLRKFMGFNQK